MERQGSDLDMNEPPNLGMVEQSASSKPLSNDEENTALKGAGITHQADADRKETFVEIYFERYPSLNGPGDPKYEEALLRGNHGQFIPEEDNNTTQHQVPLVIVDQRSPPSRVTARKNLFEKRVSFEHSTKFRPGSYIHPKSRLEESNQPLDFSLIRDDNVPLGVDLYDNYLSIDNEFDMNTNYSMKTDFVTGFKDHEHIRSKAVQRDVLKRHRMGELKRDSQFSDCFGQIITKDSF